MNNIKYATHVIGICCMFGSILPSMAQTATTSPVFLRPEETKGWPDITKEVEELKRLPQTTEEEKAYKRKEAIIRYEIQKRMFASARADFKITGEVVDEDGNRLTGVKLVIERNEQLPIDLIRNPPKDSADMERYHHKEERVVDGIFDVKATDCGMLNIRASKEGYHENHESFAAILLRGFTKEQVRNMLKENGMSQEPVTLEKTAKIILRKEIRETKLEDGFAKILVKADGSATLIDLSQPKTDKRFVQKVVADISKDNDIPANRIWCTIPYDREKGIFETVQVKRNGQLVWVLKQLTLHINGNGAGIILFEPHKTPPSAWREMQEAPKDGYKSELVITPEIMRRSLELNGTSQDGGVYFFVKTPEGKYAKGRIGYHDQIWREEKDLKENEIYLRMRIQPDGSRNTATER